MKIENPKKIVSQSELENMPAYKAKLVSSDDTDNIYEKEAAAAVARLERLKLKNINPLFPFEIDDETVYIKVLTYKELAELTEDIVRDARGTLNLSDDTSGGVKVSKIVLLRCVCNQDGTPYFTIPLLEEYFDEPSATGFIGNIFVQALSHNPDILNTVKKT